MIPPVKISRDPSLSSRMRPIRAQRIKLVGSLLDSRSPVIHHRIALVRPVSRSCWRTLRYLVSGDWSC